MQPAIGLIAGLQDPVVDELRALLEGTPQILFSREAASDHSAKLSLPREDGQLLLEAVVSLIYFMGSHGKSAEEVVKEVSKTTHGMSIDQARFEKNLARILKGSGLVFAAKALSVATDCPRLFTEARVISDLRPIFGDTVAESPLGAVITHSLRITYAEEGDEKEFFVSLDSRDLTTLQDHIARALQKDKTLRALVANTKLKIYETS